MKALVSGQAGVVIFIDKDRISSLHLDEEKEVLRTEEDIRYLLADTNDVVELNDTTPDTALAALELAYQKDRALHLILILLDREADPEARRMSAECLEEFLEEAEVVEFICNRLYSAPLPQAGDFAGALSYAKEASAPRLSVLLEELVSYQPVIRECHEIWNALPHELFGSPQIKKEFTSVTITTGLFRKFIQAKPIGVDDVLHQSLMDPQLQQFQIQKQVLLKWEQLFREAKKLKLQSSQGSDHAQHNETTAGPPDIHPLPQLQNDSAKSPTSQATPVTIEHCPLLSLFATGQLAPVQAAAIASLPDALLDYTSLSAKEILRNWCQDMPLFQGVYETGLGRIGLLLIPQFSSQLYDDQPALLDRLVETLSMAKTLGAQTVSLIGLLPSATDYGHALAERIGDRQRRELPRLTTGHATTAATVVLSLRRILAEAGRSMAQERVGVLGLGSIGTATLRLMLSSLPHPDQIVLCDVYEKQRHLEALRQELVTGLNFHGKIHIIDAQATIPPAFYNATLIIGASNVPDILDIHHVQPGTLIVDDSTPHCFSAVDAVRRFQEQADILFTVGGVLRAPTRIRRQFYLPRQDAHRVNLSAFTQVNPYEITGSIFSSLLSARFSQLPPTVGLADNTMSRQHFETLEQLDFQAPQLHCEGYILEAHAIQRFRQRFGRSPEYPVVSPILPQKEQEKAPKSPKAVLGVGTKGLLWERAVANPPRSAYA